MPKSEPIWRWPRSVGIDNRGLNYGDGLFETILVSAGRPWLMDHHLQRLLRDAGRLDIEVDERSLLALLDEALEHAGTEPWCVLKLVATRAASARGYGYTDNRAELLASLSAVAPWPDVPEPVNCRVAHTRLSLQPILAGIKHLNRLEQVLARAEEDPARYPELVMLDAEGRVVEGVMSNLFARFGDELVTPELSRCGVAGVCRRAVMELSPVAGSVLQRDLSLDELLSADEVFFTNSVRGVRPVVQIDTERGATRYDSTEAALRLHERFRGSLC